MLPPIAHHRRRLLLLGGSAITDFDVDADTSTVELSSSTVVTGETITLTIVARNAEGQALANKAITSVTLDPLGSGTVTGSGNTNAFGIATRTIEGGDVANGNTVTVVCDGVSLTQVPTFDVTAAPPPEGGLFADGLFVDGLFVEGMFV
jgi:hypothetical protein